MNMNLWNVKERMEEIEIKRGCLSWLASTFRPL